MKNFMNYDFYITKIILAILVLPGNSQHFHPNRPSHGLVFMLEGGNTLYEFDDGTSITVRAGEMIYLPKHSTYTAASSDNISTFTGCYAINFDLSEDITFAPFLFNPKNNLSILEHFKKAEKYWKTKNRGYIMKCMIELLHIIDAMQTEYMANYIDKQKLNVLAPALTYIHNNYTTELLNISELSALCNIGPAYFRKLFKQAYGISPIKYINNLKIMHAKELISSGMYTITQAAEQSGYTDMSHFSREFKKTTGIAPSNFLKN